MAKSVGRDLAHRWLVFTAIILGIRAEVRLYDKDPSGMHAVLQKSTLEIIVLHARRNISIYNGHDTAHHCASAFWE